MASLVNRNGTYYIQYSLGGKPHRVSLRTQSLQLAKDKVRQFESAKLRGSDSPLPMRTSIADVLTAYVADIRGRKPGKSAQTEIYHLREMFGPICEAVTITSRKVTEKSRKRALLRPRKEGQDLRRRAIVIQSPCFELITTAQVAAFISGKVQSRGLSPKTANHYRQILVRLFNWAIKQYGIRMLVNPAAAVERYREHPPRISFLTLPQIEEQFSALIDHGQLKTMVAVMIYAGLRREEVVWLTAADVDLNFSPYGVIHVRAKEVGDEKWKPKTINRAVPISSMLRPYLQTYTRRPSHGDWYFPSPDGKRWDADNFSHDLADLQKKNGLQWSAGDFRHTFGSQLAQKGESLYKISKLMGNSPEICRRHYAALTQDSLIDTVEFPTLRRTS